MTYSDPGTGGSGSGSSSTRSLFRVMARDPVNVAMTPVASMGGVIHDATPRITAGDHVRHMIASAADRIRGGSSRSSFTPAPLFSTQRAVAPLVVADKDNNGLNDISVAESGALALIQSSECGDGVVEVR